MDRHPELRRLAQVLLDAVIADQDQQTAKLNNEKPKEGENNERE